MVGALVDTGMALVDTGVGARSWTPGWGRARGHRDGAEALARHLHDERVETITPTLLVQMK